jgi:hypothetical protein
MKELILLNTKFMLLKETLLEESRKNLKLNLRISLKPFFEQINIDINDDIHQKI